MMKKETLGSEMDKLQKLKEERKAEKASVRILKEKNRRLKMKLNGYQIRERLITRGVIIFVVVVAMLNRGWEELFELKLGLVMVVLIVSCL